MDNDIVEQAGCFSRIVSHEQARQAAKNFIDAHFNNKDGKGVLTNIPARPDHDDLLLSDYIRQRAVVEQTLTTDLARVTAERDARIKTLEEALRHIKTMRPAGDIATATGTRTLVQRMEMTAIKAIGEKP